MDAQSMKVKLSSVLVESKLELCSNIMLNRKKNKSIEFEFPNNLEPVLDHDNSIACSTRPIESMRQ